MEFPTITDVFEELRQRCKAISWSDVDETESGLDVRLQVYPDGNWAIRIGGPSYDPDHRGFWGASMLGSEDTPADLLIVADDLVSQARDDADQSEAVS